MCAVHDNNRSVHDSHKLTSCYNKYRWDAVEASLKYIIERAKSYQVREPWKKFYIYQCSHCKGLHLTSHSRPSQEAIANGNVDRVIRRVA